MSYTNDRRWSDIYIPAIVRAIAPYAIGVAPDPEDQCHNTDLLVLTNKCQRVACRVRRARYLADYGDEFTIRSSRDSGSKTELAKILEGWGDYLFYSFAGRPGTLARWTLADLHVFREWYSDGKGTEMPNGDGTYFLAFNWDDLPPQFIITRSPSPEDRLISALVDLFSITDLSEEEERAVSDICFNRSNS
jgi:hypothetical protein